MAINAIILLVAGISIVTGALKKECPPPESTSCACVNRSGPILSCYKINSQNNLQNILAALKGYSVERLTLSGIKASTIPVDLYNGLHVEDLVLDKFEVEDASFLPGRRHFTGLEDSLQDLEIRDSFKKDRHLLNLKLDHLKHLKVVLLDDNKIPVVGNDWFTDGPKTLTTLIFERNGIEELGDKAFQSLTSLRLLAVAGNDLRDISRSMLPSSADELQKLDLAYNKIRTLPSDLFSGMPSLADINIGNNLIHLLPEDTWSSPLSSLQSLYFDGNPLKCDKELRWVCQQDYNVITAKCMEPVDKRGLPLTQFCKA